MSGRSRPTTTAINLLLLERMYGDELIPHLFRRRILPSDLSGDKAFGDVSRFQIKMAVNRADLAGDVEARDRSFHRFQDALIDVVLGACHPA